jgi:pseudouridine-5'-phosphate glycosidase
MDAREVAEAAAEAERRADAAGAHGKARTPFLLASLADLTAGRSLVANLALLEDNARVAADVATALSATRSSRSPS